MYMEFIESITVSPHGYLVQLVKKQHKQNRYFSENNNIQLGKHLLTTWQRILVQLQIILCKNSTLGSDADNYIFTDQIYSTVEPHLTVTSLVRSPHHYGHPCSVPNCIPQCKLASCNMVTSQLRSRLPSPVGDRITISEVPLYTILDFYR